MRFVFFTSCLLVGVLAAVDLLFNRSFDAVVLNIADWEVELSSWLFWVLVFFSCWVLLCLLRLCVWVFAAPHYFSLRRKNRQVVKNLKGIERIVFFASQGRWSLFLKQVDKMRPLSDGAQAGVVLLLCQALKREGFLEKADLLLGKLSFSLGEDFLQAALVEKVDVWLRQGKLNEAAEGLKQLNKQTVLSSLANRVKGLNLLLMHHQSRHFELLNEWKSAEVNAKPHMFEIQELVMLLKGLCASNFLSNSKELLNFWQSFSHENQYDESIFLAVIDCLEQWGDIESLSAAENLLSDCIKDRFNKLWVMRFSNLAVNMDEGHLSRLRSWVKGDVQSTDLLACIGQVAIRVGQLDVAYTYLTRALALEMSHGLSNFLMGVCLERKNRKKEALFYFKQSAGRSIVL